METVHEVDDRERLAFRHAVCARIGPWAILMAAAAVLAVTVLNALVGPAISVISLLLNLVAEIVFLAILAIGRVGRLPDRAWPWMLTVAAVALAGEGLAQVYVAPDGSSFAYVLVIMVAFAPLTLAWAPAVLGSAVMIVGCVIVALRWPGTQPYDWAVSAVAASAVGLGLLWLQIRATDALADVTGRARALATVDELTGVLNRHGLRERVPVIVALADRLGQPTGVAFLDVRGLKSANDTYGHEAGDELLRAVAAALRAEARSADIVGRWGGDEFVVLGVGEPGDPDSLEVRLTDHIRRAGLDERLRPVRVSIGTARGHVGAGPEVIDAVGAIIAAADADMYRRRTERASTD